MMLTKAECEQLREDIDPYIVLEKEDAAALLDTISELRGHLEHAVQDIDAVQREYADAGESDRPFIVAVRERNAAARKALE